MLKLAVGKQILCSRGSRHPASGIYPGIPDDVSVMQLRAHEKLDVPCRKSGSRQVPLVAIGSHHVPERQVRSLLVSADAGVDQNDVVWCANDIAYDADN